MPRGDGSQVRATATVGSIPISSSKPFPVKAAVITVIALTVLGVGGYFAYAKFYAPKVAHAPVPYTDPHPFKSTVPVQQTPSTTPTGAAAAQSQIPDSWRTKYFGSAICTNQQVCGDSADPSQSGLTNLEAYSLKVDPNNAADDGCGIANGDAVHVFNLDVADCHTGGSKKYTDVDDLNSHYDSRTGAAFTPAELTQIAANIKQYGLHSPTTATLSAAAILFYTGYGQTPAPSGAAAAGTGTALDRDTQRSTAINEISYALLQYAQTNGTYPNTTSFSKMFSSVQPLLAGQAVNPTDPTNVAPYVYTYAPVSSGKDFSLTYYSETQSQAVVINAALAQKSYATSQENQRDIKREGDLQNISNALQLYSSANANPANPGQQVYPTEASLQSSLVPTYLNAMPVDPSTGQPYAYSVSADSASFSLQAVLENPPVGKKGYLCTQDTCALY
jgi:hypothetical protein